MIHSFSNALKTSRWFVHVSVLFATPLAAQVGGDVTVEIDTGQSFQTIEGFGTCYVDWTDDQRKEYQDPEFFDTVVYDLGMSIVRQQMQDELEPVNDNDDPDHFNWDGFMVGDVGSGWSFEERMRFLEEFKKRGVTRFIMSPWSPPAFMKTHKAGRYGGHLRVDSFDEYAEYMAANIILAKENHGIDIGYITIQNELLFIEPYHSCIYSGYTARDAVRALMRKFEKENIGTKILMPEDMMIVERMLTYIEPTMSDPETREFPGGFCTHRRGGYETVAEWDERTRQYGRQNWMTETSGHPQTWEGAMKLATDMYDYLVGGNFSVWIYWQISDTPAAEEFALMIDGVKGPKYYASKHFYRYVRPGAVRVAGASDDSELKASVFRHDTHGTVTAVLINTSDSEKRVSLGSASDGTLPDRFAVQLSTESLGCEPQGDFELGETLTMPPKSIATLHGASEELATKQAVEDWPTAWTGSITEEGQSLGVTSGERLKTADPTDTFTPLHSAILKGQLDQVDELLDQGADADAAAMDGWTPLHMAAATFVGDLPGQGGERPITKYDVFNRVMQAEPDVHARTTDGWTPLHAAVANAHTAWQQLPEHNLNRIRDLIDAGAEVDATDEKGRTPLHWAAWQGPSVMHNPPSADVALALLERGADPNAIDDLGRSPLHYAAQMGYQNIVPALMRAGAKFDLEDADGRTAAQLAEERALSRIVELLQGGVENLPRQETASDPAATEGSGRLGRELLRAAWDGDAEQVKALLAEGADLNYVDTDGFRPIDRARDGGYTEIVRILEQAESSEE